MAKQIPDVFADEGTMAYLTCFAGNILVEERDFIQCCVFQEVEIAQASSFPMATPQVSFLPSLFFGREIFWRPFSRECSVLG